MVETVQILRIYLDACALNRLTDEQGQPRIRAEAEAVEDIFLLLLTGRVEWVASNVLAFELSQNRDQAKRKNALGLLGHAGPLVVPTSVTRLRAEDLGAGGYGALDAFHLAHAEQAKVDALLTTDDRFAARAARGVGSPLVRVVNPVDWLQEVRPWLQAK